MKLPDTRRLMRAAAYDCLHNKNTSATELLKDAYKWRELTDITFEQWVKDLADEYEEDYLNK